MARILVAEDEMSFERRPFSYFDYSYGIVIASLKASME